MLYSPIQPEKLQNPLHKDHLVDYELYLDSHRAASTVKIRVWYSFKLCLWSEAIAEEERSDLDVWGLNYSHLNRWLSRDVGPSASSKYSARCSARAFYNWGQTSGHLDENLALKLPSVRRPRGVPRACPEAVLERGLSRCTRLVDVLMLLLGAYAGLRAREIAAAHTNDILPGNNLRVVGKGDHERVIPLHPILQKYIPLFSEGYFFPSEHSPTGHYLPASIGQRVQDLLGIRGWNSHSLRHRFATQVYRANPDLLALKQLLGHRSVATTQIYADADPRRLSDYVAALPQAKNLPNSRQAVLLAQ